MRCCSFCQARWSDSIGPENVKYPLAGDEEIVRDDPAVAAPPHCLRAHHGAAPEMAKFAQPCQARLKNVAHRIVGVIVKTLIFPETVDVGWDFSRPRAPTAQLCDMRVCD